MRETEQREVGFATWRFSNRSTAVFLIRGLQYFYRIKSITVR
jgi:hypothetical protein